MAISGNQLLSALGSGILPGEGSRAEKKHADGLSFEEILSKVKRGEPSELGVELGKGMQPDSVSTEAREQIGIAADRAVISGIGRAVVDLGESIVRLDVRNRVIEAQIEPGDGEVVDRIDGFVSLRQAQEVPEGEDGAEPEATLSTQTGPARIVRNVSLADVLSAHLP